MNLVWLFCGGVVGLFNIATQWWLINQLRPESTNQGLIWTMGSLLRWLLIAGLFILALQYGPVPAVLVLAGLWITRWSLLGWLTLRDQF